MQRPIDAEAPPADDRGQQTWPPRNTLLVITETGHGGFLSPTSDGKAAEKPMAELAAMEPA